MDRTNDRNESKENSKLNKNEYVEKEGNMKEKVHLEIRFSETEDGFRWEAAGDKDTLRELGIGPFMLGRRLRRGLGGNGERKARRRRWTKLRAKDRHSSQHEERKPHRGGLRAGRRRRSCHGQEDDMRRRPTGQRSHGRGHHGRVAARDAQIRHW